MIPGRYPPTGDTLPNLIVSVQHLYQNGADAAAVGGLSTPQGRLTLTSATPVLTSSVTGATTIYYTPDVGGRIPIYDGSSFAMTAFSELSQTTGDTTKNPAAIGSSKVNDWFVWDDSGTLRLSHGPDWTSDTARSAGTALVRVNGIWLNNASITNGPAAQRGTYVGTTRSNASSQIDWRFGAVAAGGTAGFFSLWNTYNRRPVSSITGDSTDSWSYTIGAYREANNSTGMRCSFVRGLNEDAAWAQYNVFGQGSAVRVGIGLDTATNFTGATGYWDSATNIVSIPGTYTGIPGLGFHFLQAVEYGGTSGTFYGDGGGTAQQSGLATLFWA